MMKRHDQKAEGTSFENTLLHCATERRVLRLQETPTQCWLLLWTCRDPHDQFMSSLGLTLWQWDLGNSSTKKYLLSAGCCKILVHANLELEKEPPTIPCAAETTPMQLCRRRKAMLTDHVESEKGQHPLSWQIGSLKLKNMMLKPLLLIAEKWEQQRKTKVPYLVNNHTLVTLFDQLPLTILTRMLPYLVDQHATNPWPRSSWSSKPVILVWSWLMQFFQCSHQRT